MRQQIQWVAALAALTLAVSACGPSEEIESHDLSAQEFGPAVLAAQQQAGTAHMSLTASLVGFGAELEGDIRVSQGDEGADLTIHAEPLATGSLIIVDRIAYLQVAGLTPQGKYVELDPRERGGSSVPLLGDLLSRLDLSNPLRIFRAVEKVERGPVEQLDGVDTRKYTVTVDTAKAARELGLDPDQIGSDAGSVPFRVWVDGDNLVRKATGEFLGLDATLTFTDWGKDVTIEAPPASQISTQLIPEARSSG